MTHKFRHTRTITCHPELRIYGRTEWKGEGGGSDTYTCHPEHPHVTLNSFQDLVSWHFVRLWQTIHYPHVTLNSQHVILNTNMSSWTCFRILFRGMVQYLLHTALIREGFKPCKTWYGSDAEINSAWHGGGDMEKHDRIFVYMSFIFVRVNHTCHPEHFMSSWTCFRILFRGILSVYDKQCTIPMSF